MKLEAKTRLQSATFVMNGKIQVNRPASLQGVGSYTIVETGHEFNVWKIKRLGGDMIYENSDGKRYESLPQLLKDKLAENPQEKPL